ncbi:MAG TPA: hypothetical protein VED40_21385 [Azospirillaceae bacterium]|nr:hypothetical protein [Azospirillaceae bacterium]
MPSLPSCDVPSPGGFARRRLLAGLAALVLTPLAGAAPARAAGGETNPEIARRIALQPFLLPGRDRFSYMKLEVVLVLKLTETVLEEAALVNQLKPRIVGTITEALTAEHFTEINLTSKDVKWLKDRIRDLANAACNANLVEEVMIVSLLTN